MAQWGSRTEPTQLSSFKEKRQQKTTGDSRQTARREWKIKSRAGGRQQAGTALPLQQCWGWVKLDRWHTVLQGWGGSGLLVFKQSKEVCTVKGLFLTGEPKQTTFCLLSAHQRAVPAVRRSAWPQRGDRQGDSSFGGPAWANSSEMETDC